MKANLTKGKEKLDNLQQVAIWLIKTLCLDTNATEASYKVKGISHFGKVIGDYEITIKKNIIL